MQADLQAWIVDAGRPKASAITHGEIRSATGHWGDGWVIDAEPFVMMRCREIFRSAASAPAGRFTHRPLHLPKTPDLAKDILWLADRYPLAIEDGDLRDISRLARRYDKVLDSAAKGDSNKLLVLSPQAAEMSEPARPHQLGFRNLALEVRRMLLADDLGLGKTISAITLLCEPESRPAIYIVPTHLMLQWQRQIKRFLPSLTTHIIRGTKPYALPENCDVVITAYSRLGGWEDTLVPAGFKTAVFDEVQDLRHKDTVKRNVSRAISETADVCIGLSATPIYNMGGEIWSVLDVISPGGLGPESSFKAEWCTDDKVNDPVTLNSYLKSRGLLLRRTRKDIGVTYDPVQKDIITLEGDLSSLAEIQDVAKALALTVLSGVVGESDVAMRELDWKLRHATGVAKAKSVAQFVKMLVDSGEKVLLAGWHREVYEIWWKELSGCCPVMYTGTESPKQKGEAVKEFMTGRSNVFIISLRSGAGLDGLQHVCSSVVFGELDWSPHVMDQLVGRLDREGQTKGVNAYYLTIDDGADPFMMSVLGDKRSQHDGLVEGKAKGVQILESGVPRDRLREMAESYLVSIGEAIPSPVPVEGLQAEIAAALSRLRVPSNSEKEMQEAIWSVLPSMVNAEVHREYRYGERGRLDFLAIRDGERIAVECKIDQTGRASVYRQVRRYAEEAGITGVVILAPWSGVRPFVIGDVPVSIVDWSKQRL